MKGTTFASYIRKETKTNSTTFSDADIVLYANIVKDDLAAEIVSNVDEGYFDMELTRDLEANIRDYTFPDDLLKHIKLVTAKLDGSNWSPLVEADISQFDDTPILANSYIRELYSGRKPEFLISGRGLRLLTGDDITAVVDGLNMLAEIYPEDITTTTLAATTDLSIPSSDTTHALPRQVHKHWATMVVIAYKQSRDKPIPLTKQEQKVEFDLQEAFKKLTPRNTNRSFIASTPRYDGQNY
jgi:hypothetical protein